MKYMKKIVAASIILCALYLPIYVVCNMCGINLPDSLTDRWFTVFGIELGATAFIKVAEVIGDKLTKKKEDKT